MSSIYTPGIAGAFVPLGNTITFLANTAAPTAVQVVQSGANNVSYCQYRIYNSGNFLVFLGWGANASIANTNANVVISSSNSLPILPGTLEVVSLPANVFMTGITSTSNSQVYVTPGLGV